jgi:hypothetical protein
MARKAKGAAAAGIGPLKSWDSIPAFPRANYECDVPWTHVEDWLARNQEIGLDLEPDFQRAHVWTDAQRRAYVEYALRGGEVGRRIVYTCTDWNRYPVPDFAICDGKQRLESVRRFVRGELKIFADAARPQGYAIEEFEGKFRVLHYTLRMVVVECPTRADVLKLYLAINAGGTPHTPEEIEKVRAMLRQLEPGGSW